MFFTKKVVFISIIVFISLLLAMAPASLAYSLLPKNAPFQMTGIGGSIWNGKAVRVKAGEMVLDSASWNLSAISLLTGKVGGYVRIKDKQLPTSGYVYSSFSGQNQTVQDLTTKLSNSMINQLVNQRGVSIGGTMLLDVDEVVLNDSMIDVANLQVDWHKAQVSSNFGNVHLGQVNIDIEKVAPGELKVKFTEVADVLDFSFDVVLKKTGELTLNGTIKSDLPNDIANMLKFFRPTQEKDRLRINYRTAIPLPSDIKF